jgi:hypothetical protein
VKVIVLSMGNIPPKIFLPDDYGEEVVLSRSREKLFIATPKEFTDYITSETRKLPNRQGRRLRRAIYSSANTQQVINGTVFIPEKFRKH